MRIKNLTGDLSQQQKQAIDAVEKVYRKVCNNQTFFSERDVKNILKDIKEVNNLCKVEFNKPMYVWQADSYRVQTYLENQNEFIFVNGATMTWTRSRWEEAMVFELGASFYRDDNMCIHDHHLRLMSCWLLFQFFDTSVLNGDHCRQIIDLGFEIAGNADGMIERTKAEIKQWRINYDSVIKLINDNKRLWRKEKARYERIYRECMKPKEIELYHIIGVCLQNTTYERNLRNIALCLGVSLADARKRANELGFTEQSYRYLFAEEHIMKPQYEAEKKYAEKLITKRLTKKEKREFWRRHSILNENELFRTFKDSRPDLEPAANPLETSDNQERENPPVRPFSPNQTPTQLFGFEPTSTSAFDFHTFNEYKPTSFPL